MAKQDGVQQLWPLRLSLTRPHDDFNFEELLSDLITIARMIRPHLRSAPLLEEALKGLLQDPASEDPAADSGLKAVSLLKQHSLLARNTSLAASSEGSILLCNVERHASAPARSES